MATTKTGTRDQVKVTYKKAWDAEEEYPALTDFTATFSYVRESASLDEMRAYGMALMGLTVYRPAPYVTSLVETSQLVEA